jgi:hypothetical protein
MWVKDGVTQQQFEADGWDCKQKVVTMYGGYANMGIGHAITAGQEIQACMQSKGYRQVTRQPTDEEIQRREAEYVPPSQRTDRTEREQATSRSSVSGRYGGY